MIGQGWCHPQSRASTQTHAEEGEESSSEGALARAGPQAWLLHLKNLKGEESSSEGALARAGPQAWLLHLKNLNCTNVEHGDNKNTSTLHGHCSRNRQGQWYYILY